MIIVIDFDFILSEPQIKQIERFHRFSNKIIRAICVIRKIRDSDKKVQTNKKGVFNTPLQKNTILNFEF